MIRKNIQCFSTIKELLCHSATVFANNIAFTEKVKQNNETVYIDHTYTNLLDDINAFGTSLYELGLQGKRVAVIGHNCYQWSIAHLSNMLGGIVSVPLDKGLQIGELENSLIRSEASAIVFDAKLKDVIEEIKRNGKTNIEHFICFTDVANLIDNGKKKIEEGNTKYINCKIDPDVMSILLFTSGTTSKSKAVMLNQRGIATNIYDMLLVESFYENDVNIAFLPFHHIFGSTGMLVMLASGLKTVFPDGLRYIKQNLLEYKVSVFVGVPILIDKMYSTIVNEIEKQRAGRRIHRLPGHPKAAGRRAWPRELEKPFYHQANTCEYEKSQVRVNLFRLFQVSCTGTAWSIRAETSNSSTRPACG